jgi:hypothetical protein
LKILLTLFIATVLINVADAQDSPIAVYNNNLAQKDTRFIYPGYTIKVHNFNVFSAPFGYDPTNYNGDTSQVILSDTGEIITIRAKKDSITVNDDPMRNLESSVIEIIPRHRSDNFKIYYTYPIQLLELISQKSYDQTDDTIPSSSFSNKPTDWKSTSSYIQLIPYAKYFYHIPKSEDFFYEKPGGPVFEEVKARLHLKEKMVYDKIGHISMNTLIYKYKPCIVSSPGICFRVERYSNEKYISTKYLLIEYGSYE